MLLNSAASKILIQFPGCLGDSDEATEELMQDRFLKSIDGEIGTCIAHWIEGVSAEKKPEFYGLVEFAI